MSEGDVPRGAIDLRRKFRIFVCIRITTMLITLFDRNMSFVVELYRPEMMLRHYHVM